MISTVRPTVLRTPCVAKLYGTVAHLAESSFCDLCKYKTLLVASKTSIIELQSKLSYTLSHKWIILLT
jgi:hypothetical protein